MKKNNNSTCYRLPARYTLAFLAMAGSVSVAMADGKISMDDFSLNPGETITVPVKLNQTGDICGFQADFTFPQGLTVEAATANSESIVPGKHIFNKNLEYGEKTARIFIFSQPATPFRTTANADVEFFYLTLTADDTFAGGDISVTGIELSTAIGTSYKQIAFPVNVAGPAKVQFSLASTEFVVAEDGGPYVLELSLNNTSTVRAMQGNLSLPEGVKIKVKNEYGDYAITYGERLPEGTSFTYDASTGNFQLYAFSTETWTGNSGKLFALELEMDKSALTKTSEIKLGQFVATDENYKSIQSKQELVVKVDNSAYIDGCYEDFLKGIDGVRKECDDAIQAITDNYKDVAETYVPQLEAVKTELDVEEQNIRQGLDENKLPIEVQPDLQAYDDKVGEILAAAKAAQSDITYTAYEEKVAELKQNFEDTKAYISTYLPDVAEQFTAQLEEIARNIESFSTIMAAAKEAGKPAMELQFGTEEFAAVDEQLKTLLENAQAAESAYLYAEFDKTLADLDTELANTKEALEGCPDVKDNFAKRIADVETALEEVKTFIEKNKADGTYAMDLASAKDALRNMDAELIQILADAKAAESDYLYKEFDKTLAQLATNLADTKATLENYPDVKDNFAGRIAAVETALEEVKAFIEENKADGTNAMELTSAKEALQNMDKELTDILTEAKAGQSDITYTAYEKKVAYLTQQYEETKAYISTYLPDVAEQFEKQLAGIAQDIENFSTIMAAAKEAGTPAMELQFGMEEFAAVDEQLQTLLANAKAAQSDFTYAAYENKLAELTKSYDDTKAYISNLPEAVGAQFDAQLAKIAWDIENFSTIMAEAKTLGQPAMELQFGMDEFSAVAAQLDELRKNAEEAMAAYYIPGDADGDSVVDVNDFAAVKLHILESKPIDNALRQQAADANGDGRIDVGDLTTIVDMILGPAQTAAPAAAPAVAVNDGLAIRVEGEGMHQRIGILLNAEQAYAACQMDIRLPEGVTLAQETTGEMAGELTLDSNDLENGIHRILLSSIEGASMNAGNGTLLWLDVNVDHTYNGENIVVSDVLFANAKGQTFAFAVNGGETTGLSNVSMTQEMKEKIYNAGGILMDGLKRGVNIIRGNDGSSKKVFVK